MAERMVFEDLAPVEIPVTVGKRNYVLIEAPESAAVAYRNAAMRSARMEDGKVVGMDGAADVEPILVANCVCLTNDDGRIRYNQHGAPITVPLQTVMGWKASTVKALFEKVREISPSLEEKKTPQALKEEMNKLAKELAEAEKAEDNGHTDPTRTWLGGTTATSASPTS